MISTAKDHPEIFYYYNNGITITCEKFLKEGNKLKLTKPQIINGAQTVCSIYDAYEETLRKTVPPGCARGKLFSYLDFFKNLEIEKFSLYLAMGWVYQT